MRTRISVLTIVLLTAFTAAVQAQDVVISNTKSYTIINAASPSNGEVDKYRWFRNNELISETGSEHTILAGSIALGTYKYVRQAHAKACDMWVSSNVFTVQVATCHSPGVTATMQGFTPCTDAAVNSTWNLTDTRNNVTYKVRLLADGRYWMVDDLKYPTACGTRTTVSGFTTSQSTALGANVAGFFGNCTSATNTSTPAGRGYLYDWMFVMQNPEARYNSSWDPGCTNNPGTKAACRGICPEGWHVPTGNQTTGEFTLLNKAVNSGSTTNPSGLLNTSTFNGVYGGNAYSGSLYNQGSLAYYWSSSYYSDLGAYHLYFTSTSVYPSYNDSKNYGYSLRCIRNY